MISRRDLLRLAAVLAGSVAAGGLLEACTTLQPPTVDTPRPVTTATPTAGSARTLGVAVNGNVAGFDPLNLAPANFPFLENIYSQPLRYDGQLQPQPELAESWQAGDGGRTLALRLRSGVKFHSGRELTAEDVARNLERARSRDTGGHLYPLLTGVDGVEAVDPVTVVVRFSEPAPAMLDTLTLLSVADPEAFRDLSQNGVGSGPFRITEWTPGDHLTLDRFADYWDRPRPYLDRVVFKIFRDDDPLVAALLGGAVDAAIPVPLPYYQRLQGSVQVQRETVPTSFYALLLNPRRAPFDKKEVRQGLQWALDRPRLVDRSLFGASEPTTVPYPRASFAHDPALEGAYKLDLQKARDLLAAGGYAHGLPATILVPTTIPELGTIARQLQEDWKALGIRLNVQGLNVGTWYAHLDGGDFELTLSIVNNVHRHPSWLLFDPAFRLLDNPLWPGGLPPAYVDAANAARGTMEEAPQKAAYQRLQQVVLDESWVLPLAWRYTLLAHRDNVRRLGRNVDGWIRLEEAAKG